jgi:predicted flap endonuclease-1-like 5' DNA nuclease
MAVPVMTDEQRAQALEKAMETRKERARLLAAVKDGEMTAREFVERGDGVTGKTRVKQLLTRLHGIGAKTAESILAELKIRENARVCGLTDKQRERLLDYIENR